MSDAYGLVPGPPLSRAFLLDTHARLTANVFTFIGNYLRLGLVLVLCVLYAPPSPAPHISYQTSSCAVRASPPLSPPPLL